ncbi:MAG: hypothetical protein EXR95_03005 [Gemmatimonadetes bacterium]|nr:hypothetical protein [Gemmatimonadota bacterium]
MAYALVTWDPPPGADPVAVDQDVAAAITLYSGRETTIRLMERLFVYPSKPSGVGLTAVKDWLAPVVTKYPGLQLLIIMPSAGDCVAGWLEATKRDFARARVILN